MAAHVFVDETKERGYVIAAAVVCSTELASSRQAIRSLVMPGQRRIHFTSESDPRRRKILDAIIDLGVIAVIYDAKRYPNPKRARDACLTRLVEDLAEIKAQRLVLEREDAAFKTDNALLYARVHAVGIENSLRYDHMRAHEECLLVIPDAIAWCWARGGQWRTKVQGIVTKVQQV